MHMPTALLYGQQMPLKVNACVMVNYTEWFMIIRECYVYACILHKVSHNYSDWCLHKNDTIKAEFPSLGSVYCVTDHTPSG